MIQCSYLALMMVASTMTEPAEASQVANTGPEVLETVTNADGNFVLSETTSTVTTVSTIEVTETSQSTTYTVPFVVGNANLPDEDYGSASHCPFTFDVRKQYALTKASLKRSTMDCVSWVLFGRLQFGRLLQPETISASRRRLPQLRHYPERLCNVWWS